MKKIITFLCLSLFYVTQIHALVHIDTKEGSHLIGNLKSINNETVILQTDYAGEITIQRDKIKKLSTDQVLSNRLQDGSIVNGTLNYHANDNMIYIVNNERSIELQLANITESWLASEQDPQQLRLKEERQAALRKWSYEAGVDIAGKKGNSDEFGLAINLAAKLVGKDDTLLLYGSINQAEQDGIDNSDETIIGAEYTAYSNDPWGWYMRSEFENDDFEDIKLRSILGAGLNYRPLNSEKHTLELRSGLGYRHEKFNDGTTEQTPTIDFGLSHDWQFISWARMKNKLTYTPSISDFGDYLITHDSSIEIPLGLSEYWQLRFGLRNDYKSLPADDREQLDTRYYSKLQLAW